MLYNEVCVFLDNVDFACAQAIKGVEVQGYAVCLSETGQCGLIHLIWVIPSNHNTLLGQQGWVRLKGVQSTCPFSQGHLTMLLKTATNSFSQWSDYTHRPCEYSAICCLCSQKIQFTMK